MLKPNFHNLSNSFTYPEHPYLQSDAHCSAPPTTTLPIVVFPYPARVVFPLSPLKRHPTFDSIAWAIKRKFSNLLAADASNFRTRTKSNFLVLKNVSKVEHFVINLKMV